MAVNVKNASYNFKSSYLQNKKIGFDLFIRNQIIYNPKTDMWIELYIRSNVLYKVCAKGKDLFYPAEHIVISKEPFISLAKYAV